MEITIGKYTIKHFSVYPDGSKSVWIAQDDGEGGQFPSESFEKAIKDYYDKNF